MAEGPRASEQTTDRQGAVISPDLELTVKQPAKDLGIAAWLVFPYIFRQWMGLVVRFFEPLGGDVGVDLGGAEVFVAK